MMTHFRFVVLLSGTSLLLSMPLHAQETGPDVVVLGQGLALPPGTPAYGSVTLEKTRLAEDASGTIEHALGDVAGFQQFRRSDSRSANPSAQGVTLRALGGNATSRAVVLLDGVPLADPFFGSIPFNALPLDGIGAARITRGGGAGSFGAGTVAGSIELFSADRTQLPRYSARALYGSRNAQQIEASLSPDLGNGFVSISGSYARGDGFWTTPADQRVAASVPAGYETWAVSARGVAAVGESSEIQARIGLFRDDRTLRFAGADSAQEGQDASLRYVGRGDWQVEALGYVQLRNFSNIVVSATSFRPTLNQRNTPSTGLGGKLEVRPPVGEDHLLRIGADSRFASADMYEEALNATTGAATARREASGRQVTSGIYVEDDWSLGRLILTGGARLDYWRISGGRFTERTPASGVVRTVTYADREDWEGSFRAGLIWQATPGVALRAAGYTSFRLPTINELYRGFTVFPVTTQANADLAPERLRGVETGFDLTPAPGLTLSATAFYNHLADAVANVTIGTNLRQRRNVDAIVAKGIEVSGTMTFGDFDLAASYAYNDSRVEASGAASQLDGLQPAQSPRHGASATLGWHAPGNARLALTVRHAGPQYEDDLQADRMPAATTLDGYARVPLTGRVALVGRVENLFDERVVTRQVTSTNGAVSTDLGTPQTFWIGIQIAG
ncbi:TonB-dependent receptor [Sphingobium sp. B8D3A]|uniref:TonB-dependent receptor n=1 Tax=unclassified Sphingobium TaxID=2611147 RepID=UPI0039B455DB|nr:iron complex outermembrane receptor protein [Sphingobium sp. B8D3D]MCW2415847.1 iron complex outermembrane receptor protein [Sphingobium sp. B8D3A]